MCCIITSLLFSIVSSYTGALSESTSGLVSMIEFCV